MFSVDQYSQAMAEKLNRLQHDLTELNKDREANIERCREIECSIAWLLHVHFGAERL
jgi:hypothetical protein